MNAIDQIVAIAKEAECFPDENPPQPAAPPPPPPASTRKPRPPAPGPSLREELEAEDRRKKERLPFELGVEPVGPYLLRQARLRGQITPEQEQEGLSYWSVGLISDLVGREDSNGEPLTFWDAVNLSNDLLEKRAITEEQHREAIQLSARRAHELDVAEARAEAEREKQELAEIEAQNAKAERRERIEARASVIASSEFASFRQPVAEPDDAQPEGVEGGGQ